MNIAAHLLFIFFFQHISLAKTTSPLRVAVSEVGSYVDLTKAIIEYDEKIDIGKNNKVVVKTNPVVTNAKIYMNVSNVCELDIDSRCAITSSAINYIPETIHVLFDHVGDGVYEAEYMITSSETGQVSLTIYTVKSCLDGKLYENTNFAGDSSLEVCDYTIGYYWDVEKVLGIAYDYVSIRWRGRWVFPESRTYQFIMYADDEGFFYLDGELKFRLWYGENSPQSLYIEAGEHEFVLELVESDERARMEIHWSHPEGSSFEIVPSGYFRAIDSIRLFSPIDATCLPDSYLNVGMQQCKPCPRGTCQPNLGQNLCYPC